jgi:hypothetical protein
MYLTGAPHGKGLLVSGDHGTSGEPALSPFLERMDAPKDVPAARVKDQFSNLAQINPYDWDAESVADRRGKALEFLARFALSEAKVDLTHVSDSVIAAHLEKIAPHDSPVYTCNICSVAGAPAESVRLISFWRPDALEHLRRDHRTVVREVTRLLYPSRRKRSAKR